MHTSVSTTTTCVHKQHVRSPREVISVVSCGAPRAPPLSLTAVQNLMTIPFLQASLSPLDLSLSGIMFLCHSSVQESAGQA